MEEIIKNVLTGLSLLGAVVYVIYEAGWKLGLSIIAVYLLLIYVITCLSWWYLA